MLPGGLVAVALSDRIPGQYGVSADDQSLLWSHDRDVLRRSRACHFHARGAEQGAKIRIDTREVIVSDLPRREL